MQGKKKRKMSCRNQRAKGKPRKTLTKRKEKEKVCLRCRHQNVDVFSVLFKVAQNCFQHFLMGRCKVQVTVLSHNNKISSEIVLSGIWFANKELSRNFNNFV